MTLDPNVQVATVTGILGLLTAGVGVLVELVRRQGRSIGEVRENAAAAREQVQNSHGTNLRHDVDKLLGGMDRLLDGQVRHGLDITGLRTDLQQERAERLDVARRLDTLIQKENHTD